MTSKYTATDAVTRPPRPAGKGVGDVAEMITVSWPLLAQWPHNPRADFDDTSLAELADSIAADGLLQNLVVRFDGHQRPAGKVARYEVIAGERRRRAIGLLIKTGRMAENYPIPCRKVSGNDLDCLRLAAVENVERESMHAMEEAEAFAAMIKLGDTTVNIAALTGKTRRWVQLRVELANRLSPKVKKAFAADKIGLADARVMALAPAKKQDAVLSDVIGRRFGYDDAQRLRHTLLNKKAPVSDAIFPLDQYKGEITGDPFAEQETAYFDDWPQFARLQRAAAEAKWIELKEQWSWATLIDEEKGEYFRDWEYSKSRAKAKAGAVVVIKRQTLRIGVITGLIRTPTTSGTTAPGSSATEPDKPKPPAGPSKVLCALAHRLKSRALQDVVLGNDQLAMALAVLGLLGSQAVRINTLTADSDDHLANPAVQDALLPLYEAVDGIDRTQPGDAEFSHWKSWNDDRWDFDIKALATLRSMTPDVLQDAFNALVAQRFGSFNHNHPQLGDAPVPRTVAETDKVSVDSVWQIDAEFLAPCRKQELIPLAYRLGLRDDGAPSTLLSAAQLHRRTAKTLRQNILDHVAQGGEELWADAPWLPPVLRFGTAAELEKAIQIDGKVTADGNFVPRSKPTAKAKGKTKPKGKTKGKAKPKTKAKRKGKATAKATTPAKAIQ